MLNGVKKRKNILVISVVNNFKVFKLEFQLSIFALKVFNFPEGLFLTCFRFVHLLTKTRIS